MTQTRLAHPAAQPALTGGADRPPTPCVGRWWLFDQLIDHAESRPRATYRDALVREARDVCAGCPISAQCLKVDNAQEPWAQLIVGRPAANTAPPEVPDHHHARKLHDRRLPVLEELASNGATTYEAATALNTKHNGLYKWCLKWGHLDLWQQLRANTEAVAA